MYTVYYIILTLSQVMKTEESLGASNCNYNMLYTLSRTINGRPSWTAGGYYIKFIEDFRNVPGQEPFTGWVMGTGTQSLNLR